MTAAVRVPVHSVKSIRQALRRGQVVSVTGVEAGVSVTITPRMGEYGYTGHARVSIEVGERQVAGSITIPEGFRLADVIANIVANL